jgi:hypothetical protein
MKTTEQSVSEMMSDLIDAVLQATGCDPNIEPEFHGTSIAPCETCGQVTAVTTLIVGEDGDRTARVGVCCMWAE